PPPAFFLPPCPPPLYAGPPASRVSKGEPPMDRKCVLTAVVLLATALLPARGAARTPPGSEGVPPQGFLAPDEAPAHKPPLAPAPDVPIHAPPPPPPEMRSDAPPPLGGRPEAAAVLIDWVGPPVVQVGQATDYALVVRNT